MVGSSLIILIVICLGSMFALMAVAAVIWLQSRQADQEMDAYPEARQYKGDAGEWVESLALEQPKPPQNLQEVQEYVGAMMKLGRKIEAIKAYRQFTGEGLKEAKDAVEAIERQLQ